MDLSNIGSRMSHGTSFRRWHHGSVEALRQCKPSQVASNVTEWVTRLLQGAQMLAFPLVILSQLSNSCTDNNSECEFLYYWSKVFRYASGIFLGDEIPPVATTAVAITSVVLIATTSGVAATLSFLFFRNIERQLPFKALRGIRILLMLSSGIAMVPLLSLAVGILRYGTVRDNFTELNTLETLVGIVFAVLLIPFVTVSYYTRIAFGRRWYERGHVAACLTSKPEAGLTWLQAILVICTTLEARAQTPLTSIICCILVAIHLQYGFIYKAPYAHPFFSLMQAGLTGVFTWLSFCCVLGLITQNGLLLATFCGTPVAAIFFIILYNVYVSWIQHSQLSSLKRHSTRAIWLRARILSIIGKRRGNSSGGLNSQEENSFIKQKLGSDNVITEWMSATLWNGDMSHITKSTSDDFVWNFDESSLNILNVSDPKSILASQIYKCCENLTNIDESNDIRDDTLVLCTEIMSFLGAKELTLYTRFHTVLDRHANFESQIISYSHLRQLCQSNGDGSGSDKSGKWDRHHDTPFDETFKYAVKNEERCHKLRLGIWAALNKERPSMRSIQRLSQDLFKCMQNAEGAYKDLLHVAPESQKVLVAYGSFLSDLREDRDQSLQLLQRTERSHNVNSQANKIHTITRPIVGRIYYDETIKNRQMISEEEAYIIVSVAPNSYARITDVSASALRMFGRPRFDLYGSHVKTIFPRGIAEGWERILVAGSRRSRISSWTKNMMDTKSHPWIEVLLQGVKNTVIPARLRVAPSHSSTASAWDMPSVQVSLVPLYSRTGLLLVDERTQNIIGCCSTSIGTFKSLADADEQESGDTLQKFSSICAEISSGKPHRISCAKIDNPFQEVPDKSLYDITAIPMPRHRPSSHLEFDSSTLERFDENNEENKDSFLLSVEDWFQQFSGKSVVSVESQKWLKTRAEVVGSDQTIIACRGQRIAGNMNESTILVSWSKIEADPKQVSESPLRPKLEYKKPNNMLGNKSKVGFEPILKSDTSNLGTKVTQKKDSSIHDTDTTRNSFQQNVPEKTQIKTKSSVVSGRGSTVKSSVVSRQRLLLRDSIRRLGTNSVANVAVVRRLRFLGFAFTFIAAVLFSSSAIIRSQLRNGLEDRVTVVHQTAWRHRLSVYVAMLVEEIVLANNQIFLRQPKDLTDDLKFYSKQLQKVGNEIMQVNDRIKGECREFELTPSVQIVSSQTQAVSLYSPSDTTEWMVQHLENMYNKPFSELTEEQIDMSLLEIHLDDYIEPIFAQSIVTAGTSLKNYVDSQLRLIEWGLLSVFCICLLGLIAFVVWLAHSFSSELGQVLTLLLQIPQRQVSKLVAIARGAFERFNDRNDASNYAYTSQDNTNGANTGMEKSTTNKRQHGTEVKRTFHKDNRFVVIATAKIVAPLLILLIWLIYAYIHTLTIIESANESAERMYQINVAVQNFELFRDSVFDAAWEIDGREEERGLAYEGLRGVLSSSRNLLHGSQRGFFGRQVDSISKESSADGATFTLLHNACNAVTHVHHTEAVEAVDRCFDYYVDKNNCGLQQTFLMAFHLGTTVLKGASPTGTEQGVMLINQTYVYSALSNLLKLDADVVRWAAIDLSSQFLTASKLSLDESASLDSILLPICVVVYFVSAIAVMRPMIRHVGHALVSSRALLLLIPEDILLDSQDAQRRLQKILASQSDSKTLALLMIANHDDADKRNV